MRNPTSSRESGAREAPWRSWGSNLDAESVRQMERASRLPVAVAGALMPDAHVGYGLPIGGVLAADRAVIPYAVGVDIACRMKLTVLDPPLENLDRHAERFIRAIEQETRFGVGAAFERGRREHPVMEDEDWRASPVTRANRDRAAAQLGTSGSGNHFVEFGVFEPRKPDLGLEQRPYVALLSHSGSRGTGAAVCEHYSRIAAQRHPELDGERRRLAWLDLDSEEGQEYWAAMELMGRYAAANHDLIHEHLLRRLGAEALFMAENHHNFAWRERHILAGREREVIVHRKGATPAGTGQLGVIPGSMATPAFLTRGLGNPASLRSASHGAGRVMSRAQARRTLNWDDLRFRLRQQGVTLLSAGLDESPSVYKDIETVMAAQEDLVEIVGRFDPRLVKMAGGNERPED